MMTMNCVCCGTATVMNEIKVMHFGKDLVNVCTPCYMTVKDISRMRKIPFGAAYRELHEALSAERTQAYNVPNVPEDDETLDTIIINKEPLLREDYSALEYDCLNLYVPNPFFSNRQDQINWLNELMEVALLGGDVRWANDLYKQIKAVKERANNDTI